MKSKKHFEILFHEKKEIYQLEESKDHLLVYFEKSDYIFIDYILVAESSRGKGIGSTVLDLLKGKGKAIILEVEPVDYEDTDTEKRLRFYKREGFEHASSIGYRRRSLATNEVNPMEILYWSPTDAGEEAIYEGMKATYEQIHTYKDKELYGESYDKVDQVLTYDEDEGNEDILSKL
jgi:hypothetical protein